MNDVRLNRLAVALRETCASHVLEEKWLIAPSRRIGLQWLDAVTRSGQPVLNARVKTLTRLALELATTEMDRRGLTFLKGMKAELLLDEIMAGSRVRGGYLSRFRASPGLMRAMLRALQDLRLAGITSSGLSPGDFEVEIKGHEIMSLLAGYEDTLSSRRLVDYPAALRLAMERPGDEEGALPGDAILAMPEDVEHGLRGMEREFWSSIPGKMRVVLPVDAPCHPGEGGGADAALLAWVSRPASAPLPTGDGTAAVFRAIGEVNEVREVLRRCAAAGIPFDEVEIMHTDAATYVPLLYELCSRLAEEAGAALPVTFAEGIPVRYARPGRALLGWLSWIGEAYPQSILVRMIQDGLLEIPEAEERHWDFSRVGAVLRAVPVGGGSDRYLPAIEAALSALESHQAGDSPTEDESGDGWEAPEYRRENLDMLRSLRDLIEDISRLAPADGKSWKEALRGIEAFLNDRCRCVNEFDEYARMRLLDEIGLLRSCLGDTDPEFLDIKEWLRDLAGSASVEGKGPRPGCIYLAPLAMGGHAGRKHIFIIGLDDSRFPGAGLENPLLLDSERERISEDLPTTGGRLAESLEKFASIASRIRGKVTLSYSCRDIMDDRDMFPSQAVVAAYRILSGNHEGVQQDLLDWLPEPASFAPRDPGLCLDMSEWWLCNLCGDRPPEDPESLLAEVFPHLGRGFEARRARESDLFTGFDGYVPEAGRDLDPAKPDGPILSASRLEKLGRCPLEYFFEYVLETKTPEEYVLDPSLWLDPLEKGSLLHSVFRKFHCGLRGQDLKPRYERDLHLLEKILDAEILAWKRVRPPPNAEVFRIEAEDLRRTVRIFLQEEEGSCHDRRPLYFEVAIGMRAEGEGNPIDTGEPVLITLPGGTGIRARGCIDRVDQTQDPSETCFAICDYKTGSSRGYEGEDPFQGGKRIQNALYIALAEHCLAGCHPGARVARFEYFFPNTREYGKRIQWDREKLAGGMEVMESLCEMLRLGCFPFTDDPDDVKYSDYRAAFGQIEQLCEAMRAKLSNHANQCLRPFTALRGYSEGA